MCRFFCLVFLAATLGLGAERPVFAQLASRTLQELEGLQVKQHLGRTLETHLTFTDHEGKKRSLREYFAGSKPVLLTLNYYRCPMLCSMQLNNLVKSLQEIAPSFFSQIRIVTISIDPKETHTLAAEKRANYLKGFEKIPLSWDFLVGQETMIRRLATLLGFPYRYLPKTKEYSHPPVLFFLSPQAKISQYLFGLTYLSRDIRFAFIHASDGKVGSLMEQIIMTCFVYHDETGKYTPFAFGMIRLGGLLTLLILAVFLTALWLHERQRNQVEIQT